RNLVSELFDALEFNTIRDRVFTTFEQQLGNADDDTAEADDMPETTIIDTPEAFTAFLAAVDEPIAVFSHINPPATITRRKIPAPGDYGQIRAFGLATSQATAVIDLETASAELGSAVAAFLTDARYSKVVYDLKATLKALATAPATSPLPAQPDVNTSIVN